MSFIVACGQKSQLIFFADRIMRLGFQHATAAGISFGKDDMVIPDTKWDLIGEAQDQVKGLRAVSTLTV